MTEISPRLLIVDDQMDSVALLLGYLREQPIDIMVAHSAADGLRKAVKGEPDVILLDVAMPEMDGYAACRCLKQNPHTADIPVIFLSASAALEDKLAGFAAGGIDYIGKPFSAEEVLARVFVHLRFKRHIDRLEAVAGEAARERVAVKSAGIDHVTEAIAELQRDPGDWPGLASLAQRVGINEKKLTELFRQRFGMTVFEYLVELRLETARRQLEKPGVQIQLLAAQAGFRNASDFSRAFRRRYGITPREYRQSCPAANGDARSPPDEFAEDNVRNGGPARRCM